MSCEYMDNYNAPYLELQSHEYGLNGSVTRTQNDPDCRIKNRTVRVRSEIAILERAFTDHLPEPTSTASACNTCMCRGISGLFCIRFYN